MKNFAKIQSELALKYQNKFGKCSNPNQILRSQYTDGEDKKFVADNLYFWYINNPKNSKNLGDNRHNMNDYDKEKSVYCQTEFNTTLSIINKINDVKIKNEIMRIYYSQILL